MYGISNRNLHRHCAVAPAAMWMANDRSRGVQAIPVTLLLLRAGRARTLEVVDSHL